MAAWAEEQRMRLAYEENLLRKEDFQFYFQDRTSSAITTVRGGYTSSSGILYSLCVWLQSGFPYEMPNLYITDPYPLYGYRDVTIQSYKTSHAMHVYESDWNDYVKICHCKTEYWSSSNTIISILMKGFLWIEAFEVHKKTGKTIDSFSLTYS